MLSNYFNRTIGPLGYEDRNPEKIRRALALGCSAVLVDGTVPDGVTHEIAALENTNPWPPDGDDRIKTSCYGADRREWHSANHAYNIPETREWIGDHMQWAMETGLCRPFSRIERGRSQDFTIYLRGGLSTPWHIDESHPEFPDIHIHGYGEGLMVAAPEKPVPIPFCERKPDRIYIPGLAPADEDAKDNRVKEYLLSQGFNFVTMKPGQVLVFGTNCPHESSKTPSTKMKMRAVIFTQRMI